MERLFTCVLSLFVSTSPSWATETRPFEVILGQASSTVVLPCSLLDVPEPASGYRRLDLSWYWSRPRPGLTVDPALGPRCCPLLMVASDGVVKRGRKGPSLRSGMAGGHLNAGEFSLLLRKARPADSGTFRCVARLGDRHLDKELVLYVVQVTSQSQGPLVEGRNVHLHCDISVELPQAKVSWFRHNKEVQPSGRIGIMESGRDLTIRELKIEDWGTWECRVAYAGKEVNVPYTLKIFGFSLPKSEVSTTFVSVGASALLSLPLFPERTRFPFSSGWLRGRGKGEPVNSTLEADPSRSRSELGQAKLELSIAPVLVTDRGFYTGYLSLNGKRIERRLRLELVWVKPSQTGPLLLGTSLSLEPVTSFPEGVDAFEWHHENGSGDGTGEGTFRVEGGTLRLGPIATWHAGNWLCDLYFNGRMVGSTSYLLEVSALSKQMADSQTSQSRVTFIAVFSALFFLIIITGFILASRMKSHRRNFPALEVTLATVEPPVKKV